ncbi:hypothetical protein HOD38_02700 [archaeon]|jgi:intein/homing endonuclease|nr:hypothetical protein [archaeon]MBT4397151.1 hypothetical protein [archaeon]MBT4441543.1 hypothetical protein [archaeon]
MDILSVEKFVKSYKSKKYAQKAVKYLISKDLLPLEANEDTAALVGHLMGDGSLSKDCYVGEFRFFGSETKLKIIKSKITQIFNVEPKRFYQRKGGFVLRYNNCIIARLFNLIGVPRGNKVRTPFGVPRWIKSSNSSVKRSFLIALCDDELSSPRKDKRGYIEPLRLKFNKTEKLLEEGKSFLHEIKYLFNEFGILCNPIKVNNDKYKNKYGEITRSIYFNISSKKNNLKKFEEKVGFESELIKKFKLQSLLN